MEEEEDDEEEMEKRLAEMKAEELAELRRYDTSSGLLFFCVIFGEYLLSCYRCHRLVCESKKIPN